MGYEGASERAPLLHAPVCGAARASDCRAAELLNLIYGVPFVESSSQLERFRKRGLRGGEAPVILTKLNVGVAELADALA